MNKDLKERLLFLTGDKKLDLICKTPEMGGLKRRAKVVNCWVVLEGFVERAGF